MPNSVLDPQFFSSRQRLRCSICHCAKFKGKTNGQFRAFILGTLSTEKKPKIWGKNSPKIQGGAYHDQIWNLSSPMDLASSDAKITPLYPLGAEKFGVKI